MSFLRPSAAKQTTTTTGTGTLALIANAGDTRSFQTAVGAGPIKVRYMLRGNGYFEHGRGTYTAPTNLTRDEVLLSSNSNTLVSIPPATTDVYLLDYAQFVTDSYSGASKTLANADSSNSWVFTGSSASVLTLPAISAALLDFWGFIRNAGTANVTLTAPGSDMIDETNTQTAVLAPGDVAFLFLDTASLVWRLVRTAPRNPTTQKLTSGSGAPYTTPRGCRQLWVRMWGGGGGGGGSGTSGGTSGGNGGDTIFNSINAGGGKADTLATGGTGGSSATGTPTLRMQGAAGSQPSSVILSATNCQQQGGCGGGFGGGPGGAGGVAGTAGIANTGGGGGSGGIASAAFGALATLRGGGGQGEYVEILINSPAATYTYTIGAGGSAGTAGTSGQAGGAGGTGLIFVEESY